MELTSGVSLDFNTTVKTQKYQMKRKLKILTAFMGVFLLAGGLIIAAPSTTTSHKTCQCSPDKHCGCGNNCRCK